MGAEGSHLRIEKKPTQMYFNVELDKNVDEVNVAGEADLWRVWQVRQA